MPRVGPLLALSREHHLSLVIARNARRAAGEEDTAALSAAIRRIEDHCRSVLAAHFEEEDRLLDAAKDVLDPASLARILAEHAELRLLGSKPCLEPVARLRRFGELLNAHVRYEERVIFPQLQQELFLKIRGKHMRS
jgi:hypothetical protein